MGEFEIQQQTYDAAIGHLKASLALAPANVETRNLFAAAYKAKGDLTSALAELEKVLARDPEQRARAFSARRNLFRPQSGRTGAAGRTESGRAPAAECARTNAAGENPAASAAGNARGRNYKTLPRGGARRSSLWRRAGPPQGKDSQTLFLLSRAYRCAGQTEQADKAAAAFEAASQNERSTKENEAQSMHLVQQANEAAVKNDLPGALDLLQQALAKDPDSGAAYSMLAKLYYSAGDIDKASEAIRKALERGPHQPDFLYVQGKILEKQGKLDEALASFAETTLINPRESDAYFEMGAIYQQRNDRPRALLPTRKR